MIKVLVACEESQTVCKAFRELGYEAYSCDLQDCSGGHPEWHIKGDAVKVAYQGDWDLMIAHPPCTRLTNAGVRWLTGAPPRNAPEECTASEKVKWSVIDDEEKTEIMWRLFREGVELYKALRDAPVPLKAIENPIMHRYAKEALGAIKRNIVQPWWFGDKAFKATGFELIGLSPLIEGEASLREIVPKSGTDDHKAWSFIHRMPPGPERAKLRSKTFPSMARAMAEQWGNEAKERKNHANQPTAI